MRADEVGEPGLPEPGEVGGDVLRAGKDDELGVREVAVSRRVANVDDLLELLELVEVRGSRVTDDGDVCRRLSLRRHGDAVLVGESVREPGEDAERRDPGQLLETFRRRREQGRIAAKLVEDEPANQSLLVGRQQRPGAVEMGEGAAAVDVGYQHDGRFGLPGDAHVGQVGVAEVDLGRAPCPFEQDELVLGKQRVQRLADRRPEAAAPPPGKRAQRRIRAPEHDDLALVVAFRLDEDGVHADVGLDACGEGLQVLRGTDLAAVDDAGVVRHVLSLERDDVDTAPTQRAGERGRHEALARGAGRPLDHQRAHRRRSGSTKISRSSLTTRTLAS